MIDLIAKASFLLIKASFYTMFINVLINKKKEHSRQIGLTIVNFIVFYIAANYLSFELIASHALLLVTTYAIYNTTFKKSIYIIGVAMLANLKISILASYVLNFILENPIIHIDYFKTENIVIILICTLLVFVYLRNIVRFRKEYIRFKKKVSFRLELFIYTNVLIHLLSLGIHYYSINTLIRHMQNQHITTSFKAYVVIMLLILEFAIIIGNKLYNILIFNRIRLNIVKGIAENDSLTGVLTREKGLSLLKFKIKQSELNATPLTICFIDINNLKLVNDRLGHDKGDLLIEAVTGIIKDKLRKNDSICRLGGDEFLIIYEKCDLNNAKRSWKRVQQALDKVNEEKKYDFNISVSIGFSEYNKQIHATSKSFIKEADDEMYRQKKINKINEKIKTRESDKSNFE